MATKLKITKRRSEINCSAKQKSTLLALGLRKRSSSVVKDDVDTIRGMVNRVSHLVDVEEVEA
ncbi:MAG: 50S ribosomal protein L30 [Fibrobacterota bacterium]